MRILSTHRVNSTSSTAWEGMSREEQIIELAGGMTRHAWKAVQRATSPENTGAYSSEPGCCAPANPCAPVYLRKFRLEEAVSRNYHNGKRIIDEIPLEESVATVLSGQVPSRVVSADGYPVVVHLPGGLRGKTLVRGEVVLAHTILTSIAAGRHRCHRGVG